MNVGLFNFYAGECFRTLWPRTGPPGRPALDRAVGAGRPRRRLRAVELPARQSRPQARRADRRGLFGDPQGRRGNPGLRARRAAMPARCRPAASKSRRRCSACPTRSAATCSARQVIRKLSFTGSTVVGKHLAEARRRQHAAHDDGAGRPRPGAGVRRCRCRKASIPRSCGKYRNCGQVCVSPTRFIVQEDVFEKFRDGFTEARQEAVNVGDGLEDGTQMGPMANAAPARGDGAA